MKKLIIWLALIIIYQCLGRYIFNLPGKSTQSSGDKMPKTENDLRKELPNLPDIVFGVFKVAVDFHIMDQLDEAEAEYNKLKAIPRKHDKPFSLADLSKVFKFNVDLLQEQKKRRQNKF